MSFSVQNPPSLCVSVGTVLRYVRHERGLPVHRGGDADLPERPGDRSGQRHVHGLSDGISLHRLLSKSHYQTRKEIITSIVSL